MKVKNAKIVAVDDVMANLVLLKAIFNNAGFMNVEIFDNPREALSKCKSEAPDLILLDLHMPKMSGFDFVEELFKTTTLKPPILMLTAQSDRETKLEALSKGINDFLGKPIDRAETLARSHNLIENHLMKTHLEDLVMERSMELEKSRALLLRKLAEAAEFKDDETGKHVQRMSVYAKILSLAAGYDESFSNMIEMAAPLHDIGKIGIPDAILKKPAKFEIDEWLIMKKHPEIGGQLLEGDDSPLIKMAREIALGHHEKWNGSGYPRGISGDEIPISARIVAIADVFDALTTKRPYKNSWDISDAFNHMSNQSGVHFDPVLISIFISVKDKIIEAMNRINAQ